MLYSCCGKNVRFEGKFWLAHPLTESQHLNSGTSGRHYSLYPADTGVGLAKGGQPGRYVAGDDADCSTRVAVTPQPARRGGL